MGEYVSLFVIWGIATSLLCRHIILLERELWGGKKNVLTVHLMNPWKSIIWGSIYLAAFPAVLVYRLLGFKVGDKQRGGLGDGLKQAKNDVKEGSIKPCSEYKESVVINEVNT